MSNNFVEIKGHVFKRFGKTNLYQITCSDVRERFSMFVLIGFVTLRNFTQHNWDPNTIFLLFPGVLCIFGSELIVDWAKHAFITKFNNIDSSVYEDYAVSIASEYLSVGRSTYYTNQSDHMSRKMGFNVLPLAIVTVRVFVATTRITDFLTTLSDTVQIVIILALLGLIIVVSNLIISLYVLSSSIDLVEKFAERNVQNDESDSEFRTTRRRRQCSSTPSSPNFQRRGALLSLRTDGSVKDKTD